MNSNNLNTKIRKNWRHTLHETLYEADTPKGKIFNIVLFIVIIASIIFVMLESIGSVDAKYHDFLNTAEWIITILFSLEYIARVITVKKPLKYIFSFFGIIDLGVGTQLLIHMLKNRPPRVRNMYFLHMRNWPYTHMPSTALALG